MNSSPESSTWRLFGFQGWRSLGLAVAACTAAASAALAAPLLLTSPDAAPVAPGEAHPLLTAAVRLGQSTPLPRRAPAADAVRLPWMFEPADERAPRGADYSARGQGYSVFLSSQGALIALRSPEGPAVGGAAEQSVAGSRLAAGGRGVVAAQDQAQAGPSYRMVGLRFEQAQADAQPRAEMPMAGRVHRLRGAGAGAWHSDLQAHGRVVYRGVYPGVDVAYYGQGRELEFDLIVAPGVSPEVAKLRFDGVSSVTVAPDGGLRLQAGPRVLEQKRPVAYQDGPDGRERVEVAYRVSEDGGVSFALGTYDAARPLVIDPVLSYATFLGGNGLDQCWDVAVDSTGALLVAGETESPTFASLKVVSTNGFQSTYQGGQAGVAGDAYVARLSADGTQMEWFTYLGGTDFDSALCLAVSAGGEPVVGGFTSSTNFPVTAAAMRTRPTGVTNRYTGRSPFDGFVTRLTPDGSGIVSSTLIGGDLDDQVIDLAVLGNGRVVAGGSTASTNFPVPADAPTVSGGGLDGFLVMLAADGSSVLSGRYLGGSGRDSVEGLAMDRAGLVHVVGITGSTNFPVFSPIQGTNAGAQDVFVAGWQPGVPQADALKYSSYLGGEADDFGYRLALGAGGAVWVVGETLSAKFPTLGALQSTNAGSTDGLVARLSADGKTLEMSSYFGGIGVDALWDVRPDSLGYVHLAGESGSTSLPGVSTNSLRGTNAGGVDLVIGRIALDGTVQSTFYGGTGEEIGYAVAADTAGSAYVAGRVRTVNFPVSSTNVAQPTYGGGVTDGVVVKVAYEPALSVALASTGSEVEVSWPAPNAAFTLETSVTAEGEAERWEAATAPALVQGGRHRVLLPLTTTNSLFRLRAR